MDVPAWVWVVTIAAIVAIFVLDLIIVDRRPHEVSVGEAARWVILYVGLAAIFAAGIAVFGDGAHAKAFVAGYITEYSLSVDNLFVFIIIIGAFRVPKEHEHKVLLIGVLGSLVLRGALIAAGAAIISRFEWVFYIFGAFLIVTAARVATSKDDSEDDQEMAVLRILRRVLPLTDRYHGAATIVRIDGKRYGTPLLIVILALAVTNVLFALDSIPAIFGLTTNAYLVLTANAFALMGLRQLYFMVGGLLNRLVYLSVGLAVVLAFIGVKLIFEALESNHVGWAPHIGIELSLGVIVAVLVLTAVASLVRSHYRPMPARERG